MTAKLWIGSWIVALGMGAVAHAADAGFNGTIVCKFKNVKGEAMLTTLQTSSNGLADLVIASEEKAGEGYEPTPAWYKMDDGRISVWVNVDVPRRRNGDRLPTKRPEPMLAFELKWIKFKDSKQWKLITNDPMVAGLKKAPVCEEKG